MDSTGRRRVAVVYGRPVGTKLGIRFHRHGDIGWLARTHRVERSSIVEVTASRRGADLPIAG